MEQHAAESGWRGSTEAWLAAAYEMLLESGVESVKILPLAQRLNLSRTSFYWFFTDRDELLAALLTQWRNKNTGNFLKQASAYAETLVEAVLNVSDCWFETALFDSKFEFAVRSWALQSEHVQAEVQEADRQRLNALSDVFRRFGHDGLSADVRARTIYLTQIGYISMQTTEDMSVRMERIPKYLEVFTGLVPQPRELARFFARHGYRQECQKPDAQISMTFWWNHQKSYKLIVAQKLVRNLIAETIPSWRITRQNTWLANRHGIMLEIAKRETVTDSYPSRIVNLRFLAPDIITAILEGTAPAELTANRLQALHDLPLDWPSQRPAVYKGRCSDRPH